MANARADAQELIATHYQRVCTEKDEIIFGLLQRLESAESEISELTAKVRELRLRDSRVFVWAEEDGSIWHCGIYDTEEVAVRRARREHYNYPEEHIKAAYVAREWFEDTEREISGYIVEELYDSERE